MTKNRVESEWDNFPVLVPPVPEYLEEVLNSSMGDRHEELIIENLDPTELFGISIPVGRVRITLQGARLKNRDQVRRHLSKLRAKNAPTEAEDASVRLVFTSEEGAKGVWEFIDWMPPALRPPPLLPPVEVSILNE